MDADSRALFLANRPHRTAASQTVRDKADGTAFARVCIADDDVLERATAACVAAAPAMRALPAYVRRDVLAYCARRFEERTEELARVLCAEAGKALRDARGEVQRLIDTFRLASEEATRLRGEVLPLDVAARAKGTWGATKLFPIGPCLFITPFNFPLNLVAHKVAPAIAAGCPFVLKPASATPVSALLVGEVLAETDLPPGAFSVVPCPGAHAERLVRDARFAFLSFTGSAEVGWGLKARAGKKRVCLELGGNAAVIVDETADLDVAADRIVLGAFYQSGQSCISVQRILAAASVYEALRDKLVERTRALVAGSPRDEATQVGPLIDESDARRIEEWIAEAVARGARLLCGGTRVHGVCATLTPALLEGVPRDAKLAACEAFGPVAVLEPFEQFEEALAAVNDSPFGLQAGLFSRDFIRIQRAWDELDVGGVVVGDTPSFRVDAMPYGGVKDSGQGREGVRYAIQEMTEPRLLVVRP